MNKIFVFVGLVGFLSNVGARLEQGVYESKLKFAGPSQYVHFQRSAFNGTMIEIKLTCLGDKPDPPQQLSVDIMVRSSPCGKEFYETLGSNPTPISNDSVALFDFYFSESTQIISNFEYKSMYFFHTSKSIELTCDDKPILLTRHPPNTLKRVNGTVQNSLIRRKRDEQTKNEESQQNRAITVDANVGSGGKSAHPFIELNADNLYLLMIRFNNPMQSQINVNVSVEWKSSSGYLGPIDWPLLPFYGVMCGVYAIYSLAWLILSFCQWRDLLRIQFWIGAVIALGLIEKMIFYLEHQTMNHTGSELEGAIEFAEIFSCIKKTLSFMLVVIVSVGFGVMKPRLGSTLHKVVGFGFVYFLLCSIEGVVRVSKVQHESVKQKQLVVLPLFFVQLGWFYWVFTSLVTTMRVLRLRRNEVKSSMYRHFTHTLIFSCVASVGYMLWSLFMHHLNTCLKDWQELWVDTAFWHILFSVLLLVIMILWRPTNNNSRYAYSPLLDNADDDGDDEEDTVFSEAFTSTEAMKLRMTQNQTTKAENRKTKETTSSLEDDLKWVEQHIPSSLADKALPALVDSDEEREQTKFEISKMQ